MKFALAPLAAALVASSALAQQFTINTPTNVVVCQPILLTWVGGTPPYFLSVLPGNQPGAAALEDLGQQTGNQFTWVVNIAAGTSIGLSLRDSSGQTVQSAPFNINSGPDTGCVGKNPSSSGAAPPANTGSASGSPSGSTVPSVTPSAPATTPPTTATTPPATSGTSTVSRPNTSTSGTPAPAGSNAASSNSAHFGAAGVIGAAVIALLT